MLQRIIRLFKRDASGGPKLNATDRARMRVLISERLKELTEQRAKSSKSVNG